MCDVVRVKGTRFLPLDEDAILLYIVTSHALFLCQITEMEGNSKAAMLFAIPAQFYRSQPQLDVVHQVTKRHSRLHLTGYDG